MTGRELPLQQLLGGVNMPGPAPSYRPTFTEEDFQEAQCIARSYTAPHSHVRRARLAIVLAERPSIDSAEAGRLIGWHPQTVLKWRRRWERDGFTLTDLPRPGRPPTFSPS